MSFYLRGGKFVAAAVLLLGGSGFLAGQASAHVGYGTSLYSDASIIDPVTGALGTGVVNAAPDRTVSSNAGYLAGIDSTTWANSHDNRFLYFNLAQTSTIDFTITGTNTNGNGLLNPGYSIFEGVLLGAVHDGAIVNPDHLASQTGFASWSPFSGANAAILAAGGTNTTAHWGLYRSNADVTMSNNSGGVHTITFTGLSGSNGLGNAISGQYTLGPGVYSLVVGGANATALGELLAAAIATNGDYTTASSALTAYNNARLARTFNIAFNVAPVPLPAAVWLFGSGLAGVVALARRRAIV
jgi:hypothetical protein